MNYLKYIPDGFKRACGSWRWIVVTWLFTSLPVLLLTKSLRTILGRYFASSMITEKLDTGFNIDALINSGFDLRLVLSVLTGGFFLLVLIIPLVYIFLSGGIFKTLGSGNSRKDAGVFFAGSATNFFTFLGINLVVLAIFAGLTSLYFGIPAAISGFSLSESSVFGLLKYSGLLLFLTIPVILLIVDFSRAWIVSGNERRVFKAVGNGFRLTFRSLPLSYIVMLLMVIVQVLYIFLVTRIISPIMPATPVMTFLLFLLSQILFVIKIFLKTARYGIVTAMFEGMKD
ncbi:MAG: hypothetical protein U0X39_09210 [Bacteroidales bacterium]